MKKAQSPGQMPEALRVLVKGHLEGGTMWYWMCSALGPKPFMPSETSPVSHGFPQECGLGDIHGNKLFTGLVGLYQGLPAPGMHSC